MWFNYLYPLTPMQQPMANMRPAWGGWNGWGRSSGSGSRPDPRHPLKGIEQMPRPKMGQSFGEQAMRNAVPKAPPSPVAAMFRTPRKA
jgi:hypothetical protein